MHHPGWLLRPVILLVSRYLHFVVLHPQRLQSLIWLVFSTERARIWNRTFPNPRFCVSHSMPVLFSIISFGQIVGCKISVPMVPMAGLIDHSGCLWTGSPKKKSLTLTLLRPLVLGLVSTRSHLGFRLAHYPVYYPSTHPHERSGGLYRYGYLDTHRPSSNNSPLKSPSVSEPHAPPTQ
jgi:hypothetical protein